MQNSLEPVSELGRMLHTFTSNACEIAECNYDNLTLYSNTLNNLIKANRINHTLKRSKNRTKQITQRYNDLPIKKTCDLKFKGEDIIKLIQDKCGKNYSGGKELTDLVDEIIFNVINWFISYWINYRRI